MPAPFATIKKRSTRGGGSLFTQPKGSNRWHLQWYQPEFDPASGQTRSLRKREYCGLPKAEAQRLLSQRVADVGRGKKPDTGRRTVGELYHALVLCAGNNLTPGSRKVQGYRWHWEGHLRPVFGHLRAPLVTNQHVEAYKKKRKAEGAANATCNRELATLRKIFRHAHKTGLYSGEPPVIEMFSEAGNVRKGFIEDEAFSRLGTEALRDGLWMRCLVEILYTYGWRRGELLQLRCANIDLRHRTIRLFPGTTKNLEGREVAMTDKVFELLAMACQGKAAEDPVFTREDGRPVKCFAKAWRRLVARAGMPGLLVHDLRRSAAKALRRAGVPESVIMATGGWKTASMFRRYAIVSGADQKDAMLLLQDARRKNSLRTAFPTTERETKEGERIQ
jgi:integrase